MCPAGHCITDKYSHGGQGGRSCCQSHKDRERFLPVPQRLGYRVPLQRSAKRGKMTAVFLAPPALTFPRVRLLQALKDHEAGARHGDVADATAAVRTVHLVFFHHTLHGKVTGKVLPVLCPVGYGAVPLSVRQPLRKGRAFLQV